MGYMKLKYLGPILSTIFISYMCFFPDTIINKIPSIIKIFIKDNEKNKYSYKDYIPSIPEEPIKIWKLSQLEYSLKDIEKKYSNDLITKEELTEKILKQAKEIIGTGEMNVEILHKFPEYLEESQKNSILSRIKGFFSFVNLIWIIAILGILISIGPALYLIISPIKDFLLEVFNDYILPILMKLYYLGFFDFLEYIFSIILITDGMKVNKEWGFFISLTGTGLIILLYYYSILKKSVKENDNDMKIFEILTIITLFSLSVNFNYKIFSFLTTIMFYHFIGFYTACFGLCYYIGFTKHSDMNRVITTSFLFMVFFIIIKGLNINNKIIELYRSPLQIFGSLTYFLGWLILSSGFYYDTKLPYSQKQIIYIVSLLLVLFFGSLFNLPSLTNTTYVFGVLYLMEKNAELCFKIEENIWLLILTTSIFLWICSMYLHRHSDIIVSIFKGN